MRRCCKILILYSLFLSLCSALADAPFADLHKVEGLRGIYIASYILPTLGNTSSIAVEHLASRITFNWGVTWRPLNVTHKQGSELNATQSNCQPVSESRNGIFIVRTAVKLVRRVRQSYVRNSIGLNEGCTIHYDPTSLPVLYTLSSLNR